MFKWIKFREKFSSGPSIWEYHLVITEFGDTEAKEMAEVRSDEYSWSEHFRGCEWELEDIVPPPEEVERLVKFLRDKIDYAEKRLKFLGEVT
jgi:hypothetical protein